MKFKSNFKVTAPSTIANLACGFDVLGLAIESPRDEIIVRPSDQSQIHISSIINNKTKLPLTNDLNSAGYAAQSLLDHLKSDHGLDPKSGLDFQLIKKVPVGYGLGSSSASAAAGVLAVNEAFGLPFTKRELIPFAIKGEFIAEQQQRINSIVPSLLGGLFLTRNHQDLDFHRLPIIKGLQLAIVYPAGKSLIQKHVRNNLSQKINFQSGVNQTANLGALVHAMYTADLDLLSRSLTDYFVEDHWSSLIPFFKEVKEAAQTQQALGCSIAGTGSGIFALCKNNLDAENCLEAMTAVYSKNKIRCKSFISKIDLNGAILS